MGPARSTTRPRPAPPTTSRSTTGPRTTAGDETTTVDETGGSGNGGNGNGNGGNQPSSQDVEVVNHLVTRRVDVMIGLQGDPKLRENVKPMTILPDAEAPVVAYLGTDEKGKRAAFVVAKDATLAGGTAACVPAPENCLYITLQKGETATLDFGTDGQTYDLRLLRDTGCRAEGRVSGHGAMIALEGELLADSARRSHPGRRRSSASGAFAQAGAAEAAKCTQKGTGSVDVLKGTNKSDVLCAKGGADVLIGKGGNDVLKGGGGATTR